MAKTFPTLPPTLGVMSFIRNHPVSSFIHLVALTLGLYLVGSNLYTVLYVTLYSTPGAFDLFFLALLPATTLILAAYLPLASSPVNALFCLIFAFFTMALLFIAKGVEFLGYLLLIVYVGAIAILFLFVIMLINVRDLSQTSVVRTTRRLLVLAALPVITIKFLTTLRFNLFTVFLEHQPTQVATSAAGTDTVISAATTQFTDLLAFSQLYYTQHSSLFILAAFLLLTAMVGAIVLATSTTDQPNA
jgi:NADH-quinone oxidoreductase subunit J